MAGKPFNPHKDYGVVTPPMTMKRADGQGSVAVVFEQEGRHYGALPHYHRGLAQDEKIEVDKPYISRANAPEPEVVKERPPVRQNRAAPPKAPKKPNTRRAPEPAPTPGEGKATGRYAKIAEAKAAAAAEDAGKAPAKSDGMNLVAWAKGEEKPTFAKVKKAIKAQFDGEVVADEDAAAAFLVEQGLLSAEEVAVST